MESLKEEQCKYRFQISQNNIIFVRDKIKMYVENTQKSDHKNY